MLSRATYRQYRDSTSSTQVGGNAEVVLSFNPFMWGIALVHQRYSDTNMVVGILCLGLSLNVYRPAHTSLNARVGGSGDDLNRQ